MATDQDLIRQQQERIAQHEAEVSFRRKWVTCGHPIIFLLFFLLISWLIFLLLPSPWEWGVLLVWIVFYAGQWHGHYIEGNGFAMDDHYVETGESLEFEHPDYD